MEGLLIAFFASFIAALFIVVSQSFHGRFTNDHDFDSIQKFHVAAVPRIGGIAIYAGLLFAWLWQFLYKSSFIPELGWILVSALPIFCAGLSEDITKKISAKLRLYISFLSAAFVYFFIHVHFSRIDWPWVDQNIFALPIVSFAATLFVVGGTVHALNLIDGFNGLMPGASLLMFAAIGCVSFFVNDSLVLHLSLTCFGAIAGFFILNFPHGKIFAGDSGAYFIGFLLSTLVLMLVDRNPMVSAWFPCLLLVYPIFETMFSIYRKVIIRKMAAMQPDGMHLHMLIYKKITRFQMAGRKESLINAVTSPYLWLLSLIGIVPAVIFWNNTWMTIGFCLLFTLIYLQLYWSLVFSRNIYRLFRKFAYKNARH
ncbi:MAG: glycosyltransferase [Gammaproteobacteria bacterium]|nr:glycosyltransferase [Gammaproteobacteria bacterium]